MSWKQFNFLRDSTQFFWVNRCTVQHERTNHNPFVPLQYTKAIRKPPLKRSWDIWIYCIKTNVSLCELFTNHGKIDFSTYCINSTAENVCSAQKQDVFLKMNQHETLQAETSRNKPQRTETKINYKNSGSQICFFWYNWYIIISETKSTLKIE